MRLEGSPNSRSNAKRLRKEMTPPEIALWLALRANDEGSASESNTQQAPTS
jgi:very-short-patch-repair endonuclease